MDNLIALSGLKILISAVLASLANNTIKFVFDFAKSKKPNFELIYRAYGGMPSGHSAFLGALVTSIYIIEGVSTLFFVVSALSLLFILDLRAVRWFRGTQSRFLESIERMAKKNGMSNVNKELTALAGHSIAEILVGAGIGIIVSLVIFSFI